jgi:hypothetical protein
LKQIGQIVVDLLIAPGIAGPKRAVDFCRCRHLCASPRGRGGDGRSGCSRPRRRPLSIVGAVSRDREFGSAVVVARRPWLLSRSGGVRIAPCPYVAAGVDVVCASVN